MKNTITYTIVDRRRFILSKLHASVYDLRPSNI
jgi:hypothetical protein